MERPLIRLLITPFIFFILLAIVFVVVMSIMGMSGSIIILIFAIIDPIISLKIAAKWFPDEEGNYDNPSESSIGNLVLIIVFIALLFYLLIGFGVI